MRRVGKTLVNHACTITLYIGGESIMLPQAESVALGRDTMNADALQPDVDLSPYGAHENGVSHLHVKVIRKSDMIYVADLGSTNGTFLNAVRLVPRHERLLRNGDELILGRLRVGVQFTR